MYSVNGNTGRTVFLKAGIPVAGYDTAIYHYHQSWFTYYTPRNYNFYYLFLIFVPRYGAIRHAAADICTECPFYGS